MAGRITFVCALVATLAVLAKPGMAEDAAVHQGPWPIQHGRDQQPTQKELNADHLHDVTPDQAREVDRLYDELMSSSKKLLKEEPALVR